MDLAPMRAPGSEELVKRPCMHLTTWPAGNLKHGHLKHGNLEEGPRVPHFTFPLVPQEVHVGAQQTLGGPLFILQKATAKGTGGVRAPGIGPQILGQTGLVLHARVAALGSGPRMVTLNLIGTQAGAILETERAKDGPMQILMTIGAPRRLHPKAPRAAKAWHGVLRVLLPVAKEDRPIIRACNGGPAEDTSAPHKSCTCPQVHLNEM